MEDEAEPVRAVDLLRPDGPEGDHGGTAQHLDDERLISITSPENRRSRAVMERLGLTYRGTAFWHGYDVVWYAIDR